MLTAIECSDLTAGSALEGLCPITTPSLLIFPFPFILGSEPHRYKSEDTAWEGPFSPYTMWILRTKPWQQAPVHARPS